MKAFNCKKKLDAHLFPELKLSAIVNSWSCRKIDGPQIKLSNKILTFTWMIAAYKGIIERWEWVSANVSSVTLNFIVS